MPANSTATTVATRGTRPVMVASGGTQTDVIGNMISSENELNNLLVGCAITASKSGTLTYIGVNFNVSEGDNLRVGIYSTYTGSTFTGLLGQAEATSVAGWNYIAIGGSVPISAGTTYYIVFCLGNLSDSIYMNTVGTFYYCTHSVVSLFPATTPALTADTAGIFNMAILYTT